MKGFIEVTNSAAPYRLTLINVNWITRVEYDTQKVTIYLAEEFERPNIDEKNGFTKLIVTEKYGEILKRIEDSQK